MELRRFGRVQPAKRLIRVGAALLSLAAVVGGPGVALADNRARDGKVSPQEVGPRTVAAESPVASPQIAPLSEIVTQRVPDAGQLVKADCPRGEGHHSG